MRGTKTRFQFSSVSVSEYAVTMASVNHLSIDLIVNSDVTEFNGMMKTCSPAVVAECKKVRQKEGNRLAQQRLRQKKAELISELKEKLSEKEREGREIQTRENQIIEVRDGMLREQNLCIDEILRSKGLNGQTHTIELTSGNFSIVRRVVHPFSQTGGDDLQENSFREGDNPEWAELSKQYNM